MYKMKFRFFLIGFILGMGSFAVGTKFISHFSSIV